jgi:hypothetical protein
VNLVPSPFCGRLDDGLAARAKELDGHGAVLSRSGGRGYVARGQETSAPKGDHKRDRRKVPRNSSDHDDPKSQERAAPGAVLSRLLQRQCAHKSQLTPGLEYQPWALLFNSFGVAKRDSPLTQQFHHIAAAQAQIKTASISGKFDPNTP